jgi:hypothetical protein
LARFISKFAQYTKNNHFITSTYHTTKAITTIPISTIGHGSTQFTNLYHFKNLNGNFTGFAKAFITGLCFTLALLVVFFALAMILNSVFVIGVI